MMLQLPGNENIIFFSPHPDDEILGAGALLYRLVDLGNTVKVIYLTSGSDRELLKQREREAETVCNELGAIPIFLGLDRSDDRESVVRQLMEILINSHPDLVFIPWENDRHPTHMYAHELLRNALNRTLFTGTIMFYSIWAPLERPDFFFTFCEEAMRKKRTLIGHYSSQLEKNAFDDAFLGLNRYHGMIHPELSSEWQGENKESASYAETFLVRQGMKGKRVIALGDAFLDILPDPVEREFAEGSTPTGIMFSVGGNAANFALALARLGGSSALYALTGRDWQAGIVDNMLESGGVRCFLGRKEENTAITFALSFKDGKRHFFSDFGANTGFTGSDLPELNPGFTHLHRAGFFWLPGLMGGPNTKILQSARKLGMTTSLDVGTPLADRGRKGEWTEEFRKEIFSLLPFVDIFFGNEEEITGAAGVEGLEQSTLSLMKKGARIVVVHQGEKGACLYIPDNRIQSPARHVVPENPTGAGDVFNAAFIHMYLKGLPFHECLRFAVTAGTLHVAKKAMPYPSEEKVKEFMEERVVENRGNESRMDKNRGNQSSESGEKQKNGR